MTYGPDADRHARPADDLPDDARHRVAPRSPPALVASPARETRTCPCTSTRIGVRQRRQTHDAHRATVRPRTR